MPPKRKASSILSSSPKKRPALGSPEISPKETQSTTTNLTVAAAHQTRSVNQPSPKLRRTYGKKPGMERTTTMLENSVSEQKDDVLSDVNPEPELSTHSPEKAHKHRANPLSSLKRRSKWVTDISSSPRRTCVFVEIPPPPQRKRIPPSLPHTDDTRRLASSPKTTTDVVGTLNDHKSIFSKQLPSRFHPCLDAQKNAILRNLRDISKVFDEDEPPSSDTTSRKQLADLLIGTISRSEGNSCLLLGPRGSGKSKILDSCIKSMPETPIIIRLSGWIHKNDRLAMREIAYQLGQQTGQSFSQPDDDDIDDEQNDNPFLDHPNSETIQLGMGLPPTSHLPALISMIPTLSRSTIIILDAFDLFALHPRQALLYCLLDTVQGCRTSMSNKGLVVVGLTSRIDAINLLEKRVKSRFSGRVIRTAATPTIQQWLALTRRALCPQKSTLQHGKELLKEWDSAWDTRVSELLRDRAVVDAIKDTIGFATDSSLLSRILTNTVIQLTTHSPFPSPAAFSQAVSSQRSRPLLYEVLDLPYPALCLVIAAVHSMTSGHECFTFEMLFSTFRDQFRASMAAPVHVDGGSIGMVRCSKSILLNAFEHLVACRIFVPVTALTSATAREFARYSTMLGRDEVRRIVDKTGQTMLKKWLSRAE